MNEDRIHENIVEIERHLRKIDYIIRKKGREIITEENITAPQFQALQILINNEEMTIGELSQKMALACSTITDLIDRMEKAELVLRRKSKKDKRVVIVEVLPRGHEILEKVLKKRMVYLRGKMADYQLEEMELLRGQLATLYEAIKNED
ncbi:MAG: MarR family transcriptional regulator [Tissierellia bacterium]|jgi:DNA-binding MarR family transcriptional regulator|nr:MarR family transcriptional regulator [Tissierellia bacterium]